MYKVYNFGKDTIFMVPAFADSNVLCINAVANRLEREGAYLLVMAVRILTREATSSLIPR